MPLSGSKKSRNNAAGELINILILAIYGILCGYTDFTNMADFLKLNEEYFINLLSLKNGIPSHVCFSRVFSIIDSKQFMRLFIEMITLKLIL